MDFGWVFKIVDFHIEKPRLELSYPKKLIIELYKKKKEEVDKKKKMSKLRKIL